MISEFSRFVARDFGVPEIPMSGLLNPQGTLMSFLRGMKVDKFDWYFFQASDNRTIKAFLDAGGDPAKMIIHFFVYDGTIEALWGRGFDAKVKSLKERGIKYLVQPDFSTYADMPVAQQLYNWYRSRRVTIDLVEAGFDVIPNVVWGAPQINNLMVSSMLGAECVMLNAGLCDFTHNPMQAQLFSDVLNEVNACKFQKVICYSQSNKLAAKIRQDLPAIKEVAWCPTVTAVLSIGNRIANRKKAVANPQ